MVRALCWSVVSCWLGRKNKHIYYFQEELPDWQPKRTRARCLLADKVKQWSWRLRLCSFPSSCLCPGHLNVTDGGCSLLLRLRLLSCDWPWWQPGKFVACGLSGHVYSEICSLLYFFNAESEVISHFVIHCINRVYLSLSWEEVFMCQKKN